MTPRPTPEAFQAAMEVSPYKALSLVPVRCNPARERLLGARVEGDLLAVFIVRETRVETGTQERVTHRGVRIIRLDADNKIVSDDCTLLKLPVPEVCPRWQPRTAAEIREKARWEEMCHRPGDDSRFGGRDSFSRAQEGYTPDAQVKNTWGLFTTYSTGGKS